MIAIGPAGFMQAPQALGRRTAWCIGCDAPSECDEGGCIKCQELGVKAFKARVRRFELSAQEVCINGAHHGAPEQGKRKCTACLRAHRASNKRRL